MNTIRSKLSALLLITIGGMIILVCANYISSSIQEKSNNKEEVMMTIVSDSRWINYHMAITRRYEQQYLRNPSSENGELIKNAIQLVIDKADTMATSIEDTNMSVQFKQIKRISQTYLEQVNQLIKKYEEIGYSENQGLRQTLSTVTSELEKNANTLNIQVLSEQLLRLQVNENAFMVEKSDDAYDELAQSIENILQATQENANIPSNTKEEILVKLTDYQETILQFQQTYSETETFIIQFDQQAAAIENFVSQAEKGVTESLHTLRSTIKDQDPNHFYWYDKF